MIKSHNEVKNPIRKKILNKNNYDYLLYFSKKVNIIKKLFLLKLYIIIYLFNVINADFISEIELTIKGTGIQQILYTSYNKPSEIIVNGINGNPQNNSNEFRANLTKNDNNVVIIRFNTPIINCNNMFYKLSNITKVNIKQIDGNIKSMLRMFSGCKSLISIEFNKINTSNLTSIVEMFSNCESLISLDLSNFDKTLLTDMNNVFKGCISLKYLNIYYLDTSLVSDMSRMFYDCISLKSLDLSNLNTSSLESTSKMFYNCISLISLNLSNFNTSSVTNIQGMFSYCKSLKSLNLSSFKLTKCNSTQSMFLYCESLVSLDISSFDTSSIIEMESMFRGCYSLTSLNLSNFNTSRVINMKMMFYSCKNLISLDLTHFDTSSVVDMSSMFSYCNSLIFLDLNSFNISNETNLDSFFNNLNDRFVYCFNNSELYNFTNKIITSPYNNKNNCSNPCFLSTKSIVIFKKTCIEECTNDMAAPKQYKNTCYMSCPGRTIEDNNICKDLICDKDTFYNNEQNRCINEIPYGYYLNDSILRTIDRCHADCETCSIDSRNCDSCHDSKYLNLGNCVSNCTYGYFKDSNGIKKCKCSNVKCLECSSESLLFDLCVSCNTENNYYKKHGDNTNKLSYINCYKNPEGYFLKNDTYYECYKTCKNCNDSGDDSNNNCIECKSGFDLKKNNNCYEHCDYYYYFNELNEYKCTEILECPSNYSKFIIVKNKCIDSCQKDGLYNYEYKNTCYLSCPYGTHSSLNNTLLCEEDIINYIISTTNQEKFIDNNIPNITNPEIIIDNKSINQEIIEVDENITNTTYPSIQTNINENTLNNTNIEYNPADFLKNKSNINSDDIINNIRNQIINRSLDSYIANNILEGKKDILLNDTNILYQITSSENQNNNNYEYISSIVLGNCEKILKEEYGIDENQSLIIFKIDYFQPGSLIPIIGYEIFHPETKKKLSLKVCEEDLIKYNIPVDINEDNLFMYDPNNEYYTDQCYPSTTDSGTDILISDRQNEYNSNNMSLCENNCTLNGYDTESKKAICECGIRSKQLVISELINETDLLSYDFTNKGQSSNMIAMKCYYTLFTKNGLLKNIGSYILLFTILLFLISSILFYKCGYYLLEDDIQEIMRTKVENSKNGTNPIKEIDIPMNGNPIIKKAKVKKAKTKKAKKKKMKQKGTNNQIPIPKYKNVDISNDIPRSFSKLETNINDGKKYSKSIFLSNRNQNSLIYNDYEINLFSYEKAIKLDKRTFCTYYISLIRTKQIIIFSFCPMSDYNSRIVKIDLFFLSFCIYSFINCLFFDEKTIHKIYEDEGIYNFIYLIPYILYSFIISHTLFTVIKYFSLSEKNISEIKLEKSIDISYEIRDKAQRCIKIKYICFYCLSILLLSFFWYYLSSFGAVYQNTQIYLIKNILISFAFSMMYPLLINLVPSFFRIYALSHDNIRLYKLSRIIQFL